MHLICVKISAHHQVVYLYDLRWAQEREGHDMRERERVSRKNQAFQMWDPKLQILRNRATTHVSIVY